MLKEYFIQNQFNHTEYIFLSIQTWFWAAERLYMMHPHKHPARQCLRTGRSIKGLKLNELLYHLVKIIMEKKRQIIRWDVEIRLVKLDDIKATYQYYSTPLSQPSYSDCIKEMLFYKQL